MSLLVAVWNVNVSLAFSVRELSEGANNYCVLGSHVSLQLLKLLNEFSSLLFNRYFTCEAGILGIQDLKFIDFLNLQESIEEGGSFDVLSGFLRPEVISFRALPSNGPSSTLHSKVVKVSQQFDFIDFIVYFFSY